MKYSPRTIIFCAVSGYLDDPAYNRVLDQIGREYPEQKRKFLAIFKQHFDFGLMKDKPYIWTWLHICPGSEYFWRCNKFIKQFSLQKCYSYVIKSY